MIDITFEAEDVVLKFPKRLVTSAYLQNFLEKLRLEMLAMKSLMTEEQVWELSEEVKQQWWDKNKEAFLSRIKN